MAVYGSSMMQGVIVTKQYNPNNPSFRELSEYDVAKPSALTLAGAVRSVNSE